MAESEDLWHKADKLMAKYNMVENGDNILVAFSGGGDSSALLFFLIEYMGAKDKISAAHLNHMIRGAESDRDEKFAVETCAKYGVTIFTGRCDIPKMAKESKKSLEEAARDTRYAFLREIAASIGENTKIATAHTASDNAESVIFNLARGCGLEGLCGIAPVRENIVRPLLSCSRGDVLDYCEKNSIAHIEDATNADEGYTRNFIRHSVLSKLGERFGGLDGNIFKTAEIMRDLSDFMGSLTEGTTEGVEVGDLLTRHRALQHAVMEKLYEKAVFPENRKLEHRHVEYVRELLSKRDKSVDLPGLVSARVSGGILTMEKTPGKKTSRKF